MGATILTIRRARRLEDAHGRRPRYCLRPPDVLPGMAEAVRTPQGISALLATGGAGVAYG